MTAFAPRRAFLRGLASLPLIGGSVSLIGQPTAVAEPVSPYLLEGYKVWLSRERAALCWQMANDPVHQARYRNFAQDRRELYDAIDGCQLFVGHRANGYHDFRHPDAYARAALVMSTVGCDWDREGNL